MKEWKSGSHTVLPIKWIEYEHTATEGDLARRSEQAAAAARSRRRVRRPGDASSSSPTGRGRYAADEQRRVLDPVGSYNSGTPRWLVWIPMSIFLGQHKLPSVGAILDIVVDGLVNWAASTVVGGDVDITQITDAVGRTLYRPACRASRPRPRTSGRTPAPCRACIRSRCSGARTPRSTVSSTTPSGGTICWRTTSCRGMPAGRTCWGMRHGAMAASVVAPTDAPPRPDPGREARQRGAFGRLRARKDAARQDRST